MDIATYYINKQPKTYLYIYHTPKSGIWCKDKYFAKYYWHGDLSHTINIHHEMINKFCDHYKYFFAIANRPLWYFSSDSINNTLLPFIESSIYQNMWGWFMGGEDIFFQEFTNGFILKSYRNQFVLETSGEQAFLKIHIHYENYPEGNTDFETKLTREQAELFVAVIGFRVNNNGLFPNAWGHELKKEIGLYSTFREFMAVTPDTLMNISKCFLRYYRNGYYT